MTVDSNISAIYNTILLQIYPVGSIYESVLDNDPNDFIGGKWTRIGEGRMFIGVKNIETLVWIVSSNIVSVDIDEDKFITIPGLTSGDYQFIYRENTGWYITPLNIDIDPIDYGILITAHNLQEDNNFLVRVGLNPYPVNYVFLPGYKGGEADHRLIDSEVPAHTHTVGLLNYETKAGRVRDNTRGLNYRLGPEYRTTMVSTNSTGKSEPHENMPPYRVYYAWERIE